jgi:hypothetical protein
MSWRSTPGAPGGLTTLAECGMSSVVKNWNNNRELCLLANERKGRYSIIGKSNAVDL